MKFNELTEKDIIKFSEIYYNTSLKWDERMSLLMNLTGKSERTVRKWSVKLKLTKKTQAPSIDFEIAKTKGFDKDKNVFIITYAQNNTPVNKSLFNNIKEYADFRDASIHVIAGRYHNPTSMFNNEDESWDEVLTPYLDANRHNIHKYMSIMSDIKIQPTAINPMTGLHSLSNENSCIFGSPKIQSETIPVLQGNKPKMMLTTGAITQKNYTDSKAGKKGEFHHTFGFAIVEIKDDKTFYVRQVTADSNGDFIDLFYDVKYNKKNKNTTIDKIDSISTCVFGDIHFGDHSKPVLDATFKLLKNLKPKHVVLHDIFNGHSISHHDRKDAFAQYKKEVNNKNSLKQEVIEMMDGLKPFSIFEEVAIVRSNHDDFVDRWLRDVDWRKESTIKNSLEYMEYASYVLSGKAKQGIIPYLINLEYPNFTTLDRMSSYKVLGWEVGQHGDVGANGSRGNINQFRKLNTKMIIGHSHSPSRKDGTLSVGTSTKLRIGYNQGPSSWLQSHVIIHKNKKAQHINCIPDKKGNMGFTTIKF